MTDPRFTALIRSSDVAAQEARAADPRSHPDTATIAHTARITIDRLRRSAVAGLDDFIAATGWDPSCPMVPVTGDTQLGVLLQRAQSGFNGSGQNVAIVPVALALGGEISIHVFALAQHSAQPGAFDVGEADLFPEAATLAEVTASLSGPGVLIIDDLDADEAALISY
ncbi:hypothetical protein MUG78_17770 [Gordonia alkaliphila]|uniref:hypothetical protein n=1 Tax=Gordonia alkaliphila TaxID=1053547 RepID=UPI001FF2DF90|nr:hypothetical protein [Gordonia alkaliphila]MCK0441250.1 hypothetical protein [Gordonia alkaliphila]